MSRVQVSLALLPLLAANGCASGADSGDTAAPSTDSAFAGDASVSGPAGAYASVLEERAATEIAWHLGWLDAHVDYLAAVEAAFAAGDAPPLAAWDALDLSAEHRSNLHIPQALARREVSDLVIELPALATLLDGDAHKNLLAEMDRELRLRAEIARGAARFPLPGEPIAARAAARRHYAIAALNAIIAEDDRALADLALLSRDVALLGAPNLIAEAHGNFERAIASRLGKMDTAAERAEFDGLAIAVGQPVDIGMTTVATADLRASGLGIAAHPTPGGIATAKAQASAASASHKRLRDEYVDR